MTQQFWMKKVALAVALCICGLGAPAKGQTEFALDFETDPVDEGVEFFGSAQWREGGGVDGSGYLSVTDPDNGQRGAILIPPLVEGPLTGDFSIFAQLRVGGGTEQPADGFSFNFVRPDDPLLDDGEGYSGRPAGDSPEDNLPEEGSTTGLAIGFDEWQSGAAAPDATADDCGSLDFDCIGISVRVDGELIAQEPFPVLNGGLENDQSLQTGEFTNLFIDEIEEDPELLGWANFTIDVSADNNLTITYKGRTVLDEVIDYERHEGTFFFGGRTGGANAAHHIDNLIVTVGNGGGVEGDLNGNGELDAGDLDVQAQMIKDGDLAGDFNNDGVTDASDRNVWIADLQGSWAGDANFDGEFNSSDLVAVFSVGKYETGDMAGYAEGDWNGDMIFSSSDLVFAFSDGGFEQGPRAATAAVPEPSCAVLMLIGLAALAVKRRQ